MECKIEKLSEYDLLEVFKYVNGKHLINATLVCKK